MNWQRVKRCLTVAVAVGAWMGGWHVARLWAAPVESGPAAYSFVHPEAKADWRKGLPADCREISPTCVYSQAEGTVYLLAEQTGLGAGVEVEFLLLGPLSDRAYEGVLIAWDGPSVVSRAVEALGVARGRPADLQRGLMMAQGERFTLHVRRADQPEAPFEGLETLVRDDYSTPAQALFARGFPFVGSTGGDDLMPASIISAYTDAAATFGLPYEAPKGKVYGSFRSARDMTPGTPCVVALKWEKLDRARVFVKTVQVDDEALRAPEALLETLKALCEDPRDVFLNVRFSPGLRVSECVPLAKLMAALERQGGFVVMPPDPDQIPLRALLPDPAWLIREDRVFQPWEVELKHDADGRLEATLCQVLEDWTVDGPDPALTRKCYPGVSPETIGEVMKRVDVNAGKVYVVFFYLSKEVTVSDLAPFATALAPECPTQWIFLLQ